MDEKKIQNVILEVVVTQWFNKLCTLQGVHTNCQNKMTRDFS